MIPTEVLCEPTGAQEAVQGLSLILYLCLGFLMGAARGER